MKIFLTIYVGLLAHRQCPASERIYRELMTDAESESDADVLPFQLTLFTKHYSLDHAKADPDSPDHSHVSEKDGKPSSETPGTPFSEKTMVHLEPDPVSPLPEVRRDQSNRQLAALERARSITGEEAIIPLARSGSVVR